MGGRIAAQIEGVLQYFLDKSYGLGVPERCCETPDQLQGSRISTKHPFLAKACPKKTPITTLHDVLEP